MSEPPDDGNPFLVVSKTGEILTPIPRGRRTKRPTIPPQVKASGLIAIAAMAITVGGLVWHMRAELSEKADRETVHKIQTDLAIIQHQLRMEQD